MAGLENSDGAGQPALPKFELSANDRSPGNVLPANIQTALALTPEQSQLVNSLVTSGAVSSQLLVEATKLQASKADTTSLTDLVKEAFNQNVGTMLKDSNLGKDGFIPKPNDPEVKQLLASRLVTPQQIDNAISWQKECLQDHRDLTNNGLVHSFKDVLGENLGLLFAMGGNK